MAIFGYSERERAYLGRQSWGKGWGLKQRGFDGYCWFPFEFAEQYFRDCFTITDVP
jgi:C1A family cysteine protease